MWIKEEKQLTRHVIGPVPILGRHPGKYTCSFSCPDLQEMINTEFHSNYAAGASSQLTWLSAKDRKQLARLRSKVKNVCQQLRSSLTSFIIWFQKL